MNFCKGLQKKHPLGLGLAMVAAILTGCGPNPPNLSILAAGQGLYQGSTSSNKVDVLWVIDNSGSMLTKQQNLANSFDSFTQVFLDKDFDFRMAIVTTDTRAPAAGQGGRFQGAPSVITNSTPNFSNTFKANVVVGATGDPQAKGLDAISLALSPQLLATFNSGFLRSNAHLAVIVLSDADDTASTGTAASIKAFLDTVKPQVYDLNTNTYKSNYSVSSVVVDLSNPLNTACPLPFEDGTQFKQLTALAGGSIASICEADFSAGLSNISNRIAEAVTEIPLARVPQESTLSIRFNSSAVPRDAANGYTYSSSGNKVVFHGAYIPRDNTAISIDYIPADIIR